MDEDEICELCGETFYNDGEHGYDGVCTECLLSYNRNYDILEKISENDCQEIKLPSLIIDVLPKSEIIEALYRYIEEHNIDCTEYIKRDMFWFSEKLQEVI